MSRIAPLEPPYEDEIAQQFAKIMPAGKPPLAPFRTIARSPRVWRKFRAGSLLDDGPLTLRQREIVIDRICARTGCEYEWGVHVAVFGERAGLSEEEIAATVHGPADAACWTEAERALIGADDALHERVTLSGDDFDSLSRWFDTGQILEILMLAGFYRTVSYFANSLAIPLEDGAARFPIGGGAPASGHQGASRLAIRTRPDERREVPVAGRGPRQCRLLERSREDQRHRRSKSGVRLEAGRRRRRRDRPARRRRPGPGGQHVGLDRRRCARRVRYRDRDHVAIMRRRREWFDRIDFHMVLWWVPKGHRPRVDDGISRIEAIRRGGPGPEAFTFGTLFDPPQERDVIPAVERRNAI